MARTGSPITSPLHVPILVNNTHHIRPITNLLQPIWIVTPGVSRTYITRVAKVLKPSVHRQRGDRGWQVCEHGVALSRALPGQCWRTDLAGQAGAHGSIPDRRAAEKLGSDFGKLSVEVIAQNVEIAFAVLVAGVQRK